MRSCGMILSEDGAHLHRFVFLAAQEVLRTARKWRNSIEAIGPEKTESAQAERELHGAVKRFEYQLWPAEVNGKYIEPSDTPEWFKLPGVARVDVAGQLRAVRAGVYSALGFSEKSAHDVVLRLGEDTLDAAVWLSQTKGAAQDFCLSPTSPLRTERQGLGMISAAEANRLEADCLWEAEQAWVSKQARKNSVAYDDPSVWGLISKLQPPRIPSVKKRQRYIEKHHTEIRSRRPLTQKGTPHPKRLEVHLGDWVRHWERTDKGTFDSLDETDPSPITDDALTDDFINGAAALYSKISKGQRR
jgi:hypothetical protein